MKKRFALFGFLFGVSVLVNISLILELVHHSRTNNFSTHIVLIPFISIFLVIRENRLIFSPDSEHCLYGAGIALLGAAFAAPWISVDLSLRILGMVLLWIGLFLAVFGTRSFRKALFPLLFLVFMIPIPEKPLQHIITALQNGSAEGSALLFKLTGTPFYREGTFFSLPGINIEIAAQCSSIRSSLALLITSLLASYLLLEGTWRRVVFVAVSIPMAMIKNAIRIVVLSLLAIHLDKGWLTDSDLHHEGGILFFILALLLMYPLLWFLRRSQRQPQKIRSTNMKAAD